MAAGTSARRSSSRFCGQLANEKIDTRQVAARPRKAGDKTKPDRVVGDAEDDGDRRGCRLGRERHSGASGRDNDGSLPADQLGRQLRQAIEAILRPAIDDGHVFTFGKSELFQALAECAETARHGIRRSAVEEPDYRHRRLLRARSKGPRDRRTAEKRDEFASPHIPLPSSGDTALYRLKRVL